MEGIRGRVPSAESVTRYGALAAASAELSPTGGVGM
jgi:hypothetical protein